VPPASHSPTETPQGSILLIEEYDALAAAISSALRKFAPAHRVHIAPSLKEAKALAKEVTPDLLVIDFDPPFSGLSPFLEKLRTTDPDARVLIIAGKLPPEVATATRSAGALQFVEKPFDVPDFGAAVQALLGPWRESDAAESRGTMQEMTLADLIIAQCAGGRTVAIEVTNGGGKSGEIHVRQGTPWHAEAGRKTGDDALGEMLNWREVEVRERERPRTARRTILGVWPDLLVESFRRTKPRPAKSPAKKAGAAPAPKTGKKLVIVDDTEMLLIFVEDVLRTSGSDYQITTAPNGISGIKEIEQVKPDLVLLDYSLPDINGDEVCRRLLQNDKTSRIPVLMMSGHVPEMSKAAATLDNVIATIAKPFLSDAFVSLVQQTLAEGRPVRKKAPASRKTVPVQPAVQQPPPPVKPDVLPITAGPVATATEPAGPEARPEFEQQLLGIERGETVAPAPVETPVVGQTAAPVSTEQAVLVTPPSPPAQPEPPSSAESVPATSPSTYKPRVPASLRSVLEKARRAMEQRSRQTVPEAPESEQTESAAVAPSSFPATTPPATAPEPPAQAAEAGTARPPPAVTDAAEVTATGIMSTRVLSEGPNEVVLSLFLEIVAVQLTPELRMGSIRAKPSSGEVSLHVASMGMREKLPQTGFKLGEIGLDGKGQIAMIRLIPTLAPVRTESTQNALQIGAVSVIPIDSTARMQLTPTPGASMRLKLVARLELAGVELSPTFQISHIVLKDRGGPIRVTMSGQSTGQEENGTACETVSVRLDHSAHLAELLLNPVR
jgi:DNA-binding response OmpR family regulator